MQAAAAPEEPQGGVDSIIAAILKDLR